MKEPLLLTTIALFLLALVTRFIRGVLLGRRFRTSGTSLPHFADAELKALIEDAKKPGKLRESIRRISGRSPALDSGSLRAAYYCAAGNLVLSELKRPASAVGFYLRALREDRLSIEALEKLQEILVVQKRLRRLEWTYWDILGRLDDAEVGGDMWTKCWSGLASIYSASPRTVRRADALRKVLKVLGSDDGISGEMEVGDDGAKANPNADGPSGR